MLKKIFLAVSAVIAAGVIYLALATEVFDMTSFPVYTKSDHYDPETGRFYDAVPMRSLFLPSGLILRHSSPERTLSAICGSDIPQCA